MTVSIPVKDIGSRDWPPAADWLSVFFLLGSKLWFNIIYRLGNAHVWIQISAVNRSRLPRKKYYAYILPSTLNVIFVRQRRAGIIFAAVACGSLLKPKR